MDWFIKVLLVEYTITAILGLAVAVQWRPGLSYWPAGRLLALAVGARGVYFLVLKLTYTTQEETTPFSTTWGNVSTYQFISTTLFLLLLVYVLIVVVRVNRDADSGEESSLTGESPPYSEGSETRE